MRIDVMKDAMIDAADALEAKGGTWTRINNPAYSPFDDSGEYLYKCEKCGAVEYKARNYCPNCGAIMDGKEHVTRRWEEQEDADN